MYDALLTYLQENDHLWDINAPSITLHKSGIATIVRCFNENEEETIEHLRKIDGRVTFRSFEELVHWAKRNRIITQSEMETFLDYFNDDCTLLDASLDDVQIRKKDLTEFLRYFDTMDRAIQICRVLDDNKSVAKLMSFQELIPALIQHKLIKPKKEPILDEQVLLGYRNEILNYLNAECNIFEDLSEDATLNITASRMNIMIQMYGNAQSLIEDLKKLDYGGLRCQTFDELIATVQKMHDAKYNEPQTDETQKMEQMRIVNYLTNQSPLFEGKDNIHLTTDKLNDVLHIWGSADEVIVKLEELAGFNVRCDSFDHILECMTKEGFEKCKTSYETTKQEAQATKQAEQDANKKKQKQQEEEKARAEAEAKLEAKKKAKAEMKRQMELKAQEQAQERLKAEEKEKETLKLEKERKQKEEADLKAKMEAKAKAKAELKAKQEKEAKEKADTELKIKQQQVEAKEKAEAEEKAKKDMEMKVKADAEAEEKEKKHREEMERRIVAEEKAQADAQAKAAEKLQRQAEERKKIEEKAAEQARIDSERKEMLKQKKEEAKAKAEVEEKARKQAEEEALLEFEVEQAAHRQKVAEEVREQEALLKEAEEHAAQEQEKYIQELERESHRNLELKFSRSEESDEDYSSTEESSYSYTSKTDEKEDATNAAVEELKCVVDELKEKIKQQAEEKNKEKMEMMKMLSKMQQELDKISTERKQLQIELTTLKQEREESTHPKAYYRDIPELNSREIVPTEEIIKDGIQLTSQENRNIKKQLEYLANLKRDQVGLLETLDLAGRTLAAGQSWKTEKMRKNTLKLKENDRISIQDKIRKLEAEKTKLKLTRIRTEVELRQLAHFKLKEDTMVPIIQKVIDKAVGSIKDTPVIKAPITPKKIVQKNNKISPRKVTHVQSKVQLQQNHQNNIITPPRMITHVPSTTSFPPLETTIPLAQNLNSSFQPLLSPQRPMMNPLMPPQQPMYQQPFPQQPMNMNMYASATQQQMQQPQQVQQQHQVQQQQQMQLQQMQQQQMQQMQQQQPMMYYSPQMANHSGYYSQVPSTPMVISPTRPGKMSSSRTSPRVQRLCRERHHSPGRHHHHHHHHKREYSYAPNPNQNMNNGYIYSNVPQASIPPYGYPSSPYYPQQNVQQY